MTKEIILTQGKVALVDDHWFEELNQHNWHYSHGYAIRNGKKEEGEQWGKKILMHRVITNAKRGEETDHDDHNTINNQEYNLKTCTTQQNQFNQRPQEGKSSQYKGVCWDKGAKKWRTGIKKNSIRKSLGYFDCEIEAARTYDKMALELFGKFAHTNFPLSDYAKKGDC